MIQPRGMSSGHAMSDSTDEMAVSGLHHQGCRRATSGRLPLRGRWAEDVLTQIVSGDSPFREEFDAQRMARRHRPEPLHPLVHGLGLDPKGASQGSLVADDLDSTDDCVHVAILKRRFTERKRRFISSGDSVGQDEAMLDRQMLALTIKNAREAGDMTRDELGAHFDVTGQAVYGWETTGKIDPRKLPKLASILGLPLSTLMPEVGTSSEVSQSARDERSKIAAVIRLTDHVRDMAVDPMPPDRQLLVVQLATGVVERRGPEAILNGDQLADAAREVVRLLRAG